MSKMSEEERDRLIAKAKKDRESAPKMDAESARHISDKWGRDSLSFNERMVSKDLPA